MPPQLSTHIVPSTLPLTDIVVAQLGKKYAHTWVLKKFSYCFVAPGAYAVTGPNGSGKSTLMQLLAGHLLPTTGSIRYITQQKIPIAPDHFFQWNALATPYLALIEDFTLMECLQFHFKFRKLPKGTALHDVVQALDLAGDEKKYIKHFSSGKQQKLKLGLALFTDAPIVLLDEPTVNLDLPNTTWCLQYIKKIAQHKLLIVFSNQPREYSCCQYVLTL